MMGIAAVHGPEHAARRSVPLSGIRLDDVSDHVPLDELPLLARGLAKRGRREAIEIAHRAGGGLVEEDDGVGGEDLARAAGTAIRIRRYSAVSSGVRATTSSRWWMREYSERLCRSARRSRSSGRPTRTSESSARLSQA